jgi:hypothetical protein
LDFQDIINEHLELRRRNARLEESLPLDHYRSEPATTEPALEPPERFLDETEEFTPDWLPVTERPRSRRERDDSPQLWDLPPLFDRRH